MSASLLLFTTNPKHISHSFSTKNMPLVTYKGPSKEATKCNTEDVMESFRTWVHIMSNTKCFIDKSTTITWQIIKEAFNRKVFPKDLEDNDI